MSKNIQVSRDWFLNVCKFMEYFSAYLQFGDEEYLLRLGEYQVLILRGIRDKIEAQDRRRLYTDSKTHPDTTLREYARQEYLDTIGMHENFRWGAGGPE